MCSVITTTGSSPAAMASRAASLANRAGTKTHEALAPVSSTASSTVSNTGTPWTCVPPLPGVTPATTRVPNSSMRAVWNSPW
jgi:hypothetical protein